MKHPHPCPPATPGDTPPDDALDAMLGWPLDDELADDGFSAAVLRRLAAAAPPIVHSSTSAPVMAIAARPTTTRPRGADGAPATRAAPTSLLSPTQALTRLQQQRGQDSRSQRRIGIAAVIGTVVATLVMLLPELWVVGSITAAASGTGAVPADQQALSASAAALLVSLTLVWALSRGEH